MISWNNSMLIGISQIDNQHRALVDAINKLIEACNQGKGRMEIEQTLNFVVSYTMDHFRDEEIVQEKVGFPGALMHKQKHAAFIKQVGSLVQEFNKEGPSVALVGKLNKSLVEWVINHIKTEDMKIGQHINKAHKNSA